MSLSRSSEMLPDVGAAFLAAPQSVQPGLGHLRSRILSCAKEKRIDVTEALRWGQPAYLSPKGWTLRIGAPKLGGFAIYAHCGTSLIADFKEMVPEARIEPKRAVLFETIAEAEPLPLELLISAALDYHLNR